MGGIYIWSHIWSCLPGTRPSRYDSCSYTTWDISSRKYPWQISSSCFHGMVFALKVQFSLMCACIPSLDGIAQATWLWWCDIFTTGISYECLWETDSLQLTYSPCILLGQTPRQCSLSFLWHYRLTNVILWTVTFMNKRNGYCFPNSKGKCVKLSKRLISPYVLILCLTGLQSKTSDLLPCRTSQICECSSWNGALFCHLPPVWTVWILKTCFFFSKFLVLILC